MKTVVIHHSADFDGLFCREIAKKFLPGATFIGWDFKDAPLPAPIPDDVMFYVLDLPIDRVFGLDFSKRPVPGLEIQPEEMDWSHFVWIDHHKTSIDSHPKAIPGYRIDGVAACRLAWQWFFIQQHNAQHERNEQMQVPIPGKQDFIDRLVLEPLAVRLAGEYDIWDKRDPRAELFQHGLRTVDLSESRWWVWFFEHTNDNCVNDLLERGRTVEFVRNNEYREVIQQQGFTVKFEGLNFLACNSHELDIRSHLFAAGIKPEHDALLGFTFNGKSWRVSLYGVPHKPDLDLTPIAKKYGGGGHSQACGFRTPHLPFVSNPKTELNAWLDTQKITSENIGEIRRRCFMPWDSEWNAYVRDETAARENK